MASPPFSVNQTAPGDADIVSQFPAINRQNMDNINDALESIMNFTNGHLKVGVAASPNTGDYSNDELVFDSDTNQLLIRQTAGFRVIGPEFPSGTRIVFQQTSAPPGWTKVSDSAYNDAVMLLTTGTVATAGSVTASTFLLTSDYFLDDSFIGFGTTETGGAHTHTTGVRIGNDTGAGTIAAPDNGDANTNLTSSSNGDHTHDVVVNVFGDEIPMFGGITGSIKTVSFIVCEKD